MVDERKPDKPRRNGGKRPRKGSASPGPRRAKASGKAGADRPAAAALRVRATADGQAWELVPTRAVRDRREDLEEVQKMIDAGEVDIAIDELRWLLNGCSEFLDAHRLLGELALGEGDFPLARGHFGYAHRLGMQALGRRGPLPYRLAANQAFHEAGKGLVWCLVKLGKRELAQEVVEDLLRCDPSDPLAVRSLLGPTDASPPETAS